VLVSGTIVGLGHPDRTVREGPDPDKGVVAYQGTHRLVTNVPSPMNVNPDPRPGRWMLPLVVLGMMLFTWVFVNQLPGEGGTTDETNTVDDTTDSSDTTVPDGTGGTGSTTEETTAPGTGDTGGGAPPEVESYLNAIQAFNTNLVAFQTEMSTVNAAWDADPKELSLADTTSRLTNLRDQVGEWAAQVAAVEGVPADLADTHQTLVTAAQAAATEAAQVLDGLLNSPGVEARQSAVARFDDAVAAFQEALGQASAN